MTKKITRYTERYIFGDGVAEAEDGEYVLYSDYEDLQREVERLRAAAEPKAESSAPTPHHVRYDVTGWLCSVCGGWNEHKEIGCRFSHLQVNRQAALEVEPIALRLAQYIAINCGGENRIRDHACPQCMPEGGDLVQPHFICSYHLALKVIGAPNRSEPNGDAKCILCGEPQHRHTIATFKGRCFVECPTMNRESPT